MNTLYIVDVMGYIFRSYHAIRQMTNQRAESTNALFGFVRSLQKLMKDYPVVNVIAVFDGPRNDESRKKIYSEYKANRGETPLDLLHQFQWASEYCNLKGIPTLTVDGVEADDTMAAIALWAKEHYDQVYLLSTDKDLCQMVDDKIKILNTFKENLIVDEKGVIEQFGVPPSLIGDYLALIGDASDNVPGVPSIGPKGAVELLKAYGNLENLLLHASNIKGKKGETLQENSELARISRKLVTLDTNVPFPKDLSYFQLKAEDTDKLRAFFHDKGFNSLLKELGTAQTDETVHYHLVNSPDELKALIKELKKAQEICIDTETTSIDPMMAELVGVGLGVKEGEAWYIPLNGAIPEKAVFEELRDLFLTLGPKFYGHNVKYDLHVLYNHGLPEIQLCFDTMIASYLLNSDERQHSLDQLSVKHFDKVKIPTESLIGKGKDEITMREVAIEKVATYCCEDIDYTIRLKNLFTTELEKRNLMGLFKKIELPLIPVLAKMEEKGVFIDVPFLKELSKRVTGEIDHLTHEIYALSNEPFNINSPKQLGEILFDKLAIKAPKKTKTGSFSTSADILESLKHVHPIIDKILEYRTLEKLRSTYIDSLPSDVNPRTNRVHCTFNQSVAATGRLSCQNPNLQNIPVRSKTGQEIRAAFRPQSEDWSYLSADYSQIELRLLAHFSNDPSLLEAFRSGGDIHKATAAKVFGVTPDEVTQEMRSQAKAVNFGIIYGQQAWGLSQEIGIDFKKAQEFIDLYFKTYPGVKNYVDSMKEEARKNLAAKTITGRERLIPEIESKNPAIRALAERLAVNTPLQGSNADLIKIAMCQIEKELEVGKFEAYMILQIHDELLFELPNKEIEPVSKLVKRIMEGVFTLNVPLVVDISVGKNWKEC